MTLLNLIRFGSDELVTLARKGRITPRHLWCAIQGAASYYRAIQGGDVASEQDQQHRANTCASCPHSTRRPIASIQADAIYCGPPIVGSERPRTCGCLVAVTVELRTMPGAKTMVASEECPQERWGEVPRAGVSPTLPDSTAACASFVPESSPEPAPS